MVKKENPISMTGQGDQHVETYGKANQARAVFGLSLLNPKEREYEEGLGRRFRDLERGLASGSPEWRSKTTVLAKDKDEIGGARKDGRGVLGDRRDGVEEDRPSPKVSYEKGLGNKFRALQMSLSQQEEARGAAPGERRDGVEKDRPSSEVSYEKGLGSKFRALRMTLSQQEEARVSYKEGLGSKFRALQMNLSQQEEARVSYKEGLGSKFRALRMSLSQDSKGVELIRTEEKERDGAAEGAADMVLATAARAEDPPRSPTSIFDMEQRAESEDEVAANEEEGAPKSQRKEEEAALPTIPSILDDAFSMEDSSEDDCLVSSGSSDSCDDVNKESKTEHEEVHVDMESKTKIEPGMEMTEFYGQIDEFCDQIDCFGGNVKL